MRVHVSHTYGNRCHLLESLQQQQCHCLSIVCVSLLVCHCLCVTACVHEVKAFQHQHQAGPHTIGPAGDSDEELQEMQSAAQLTQRRAECVLVCWVAECVLVCWVAECVLVCWVAECVSAAC